MALNIDAKFEGKLTFAFKNDMRNLRNIQQSTWKFQTWDFDGILLSKVGKYELKIYRELFTMTMKNDAELEEELTCRFKTDMRNLTNFDPSTQKALKFTL